MKKVLIYWLIPELGSRHKKLIGYLATRGYNVVSVRNFEDLSNCFDSKRSRLVIIDDEYGEPKLNRELPIYVHKPEFSGVRFVLNFNQHSASLFSLIAQLGFKDAIPFRMKLADWIKRFEYSISTRDTPFAPENNHISVRDIADIRIPARITCISPDHIKIETKAELPIGAKLRIKGRFSDDIGAPSISLTIRHHHKNGLSYRFSDAYHSEWTIAKDLQESAKAHIARLHERLATKPIKIFAVVQSGKTRRTLIDTIDDVYYDLSFALNQKSITHEPKYFNPEIVIYEDDLQKKLGIENFNQLRNSVGKETQIIVIGGNINQNDYFEDREKSRIHFFDGSPLSLVDFISNLKRDGDLLPNDSNEAYLQKHHPYSLCFIILPARLIAIHPEYVSLAAPYKLGNFNLIKIKSPLLSSVTGSESIIKITSGCNTQEPDLTSFPYEIRGILVDFDRQAKRHLAERILDQVASNLKNFLPDELETDKDPKKSTLEQVEATFEGNREQDQSDQDVSITDFEQSAEVIPILITDDEQEAYVPKKKKVKKKSFLEVYKKEINILGAVLFLLFFFISLIYLVREPPENQGREFSESYRKLYERYKTKDSR